MKCTEENSEVWLNSLIKMDDRSKLVTKGIIIDSCKKFTNGVFNLYNIEYFSDSYSTYSNISFIEGSVYNFSTEQISLS